MENSDQAGFPDTEMAVKADLAMRLASQQWDAEQENSRRLANRANGLLATVALAQEVLSLAATDLSSCV